jgi:hypothetical protein
VNKLGWSLSSWMCILACLIAMASRQGLGDDKLAGHDDRPERHQHSVLSLKNPSLDFGTLAVGDSKVLTDTLSNNSGSDVVIKRAILVDSNFRMELALPLTLSAGQSIPLNVAFQPKARGAHSAHLFISGDSSNQTAVLPLFGTAAASTSPQLGISPTSITFGSVMVGSSQAQTMILTNAGNSGFTISQATVSGSDFQFSGITVPFTLPAGQSVSCKVTFAPRSIGSVNGGLSIASISAGSTVSSNGKGGGPKKGSNVVTVPLAGSGMAAGSLAVSPSSMGFGSVSIGSSRTASETLTNSGGSSLTISQATAAGSGFSLSGLTLPLTLLPGQSAAFNVTFAPQSSGLVNGGITLADSGSNPTLSISLSGTGVSAGTVAANPASLSFGTVQVGSKASLSGTLTNSGSSSVTVSQATVTGSAFALSGLSLPMTLNAGQTATFNVAFAPTSGGAVSGNLAIGSSASNPTLNIALSGTAATPGAITASPASLSFGSLQTGSSNSLSETITNSGNTSVTISQVASSSANYSVSGITPPVTLTPSQNYTFKVTFAPIASGSSSGSLSLSSDASNPTLSIPLSGTATTPGSLAVNPSNINFGNVVVGTTQTQTATLSASSAPITVSSAGVIGSEFAVSGLTFPFTLAAGSSATFSVTFTPQVSGTASANVSFASNATNSPLVEALSGSGTAAPQHSVALSWNPSTSTVAGYNIYRGSASGGPYAMINSALDASSSYSDGSVQAGQTYYYVVTAVDASGNESVDSNQAQAVIPTP